MRMGLLRRSHSYPHLYRSGKHARRVLHAACHLALVVQAVAPAQLQLRQRLEIEARSGIVNAQCVAQAAHGCL